MEEYINVDDKMFYMRQTNIKEFSRYTLYDVLTCQEGTQLFLCISKECDDIYVNIPSNNKLIQLEAKTTGDECKISGDGFYCLVVTIYAVIYHGKLLSGQMQKPIL